jgi:hypothetical protein
MSDARWDDPREYDPRDRVDEWPRVYDPRDRDDHDPRDALVRDLDLPRGDERELVVDRNRVYELAGEESRTLAAVGAFRVVPEHDLDLPRDGNRFNRTAATAPLFTYLAPSESADEKMVSLNFTSWNRIAEWLKSVERLKAVA